MKSLPTRRALQKLQLLEKYGFRVPIGMILDTIKNPTRVNKRGNQYLAIKPIDENTHKESYTKSEKT